MRILVTGSRKWDDRDAVWDAILKTSPLVSGGDPKLVTIVHGGADGADQWASEFADEWGTREECWLARDFSTPLARNQHMVDLGADICLAFADRWASGTGNCARAARRAGIPVRDLGVSTEVKRGR